MSLIGGSRFQGKQEKPLILGHRGFRGAYPENTLLAMRKGVEAGAAAIETDIQLAKDHVVVMCHDIDTGRCFNKNYEVENTPYNGVMDQIYTKDSYREKMPTLAETAKMFISDPAFQNVRLMLDIKRSNRPHVVPHVIKCLEDVAPLDVWKKRCTFGVWKADVMEAVHELAPQIPVTFIGIEHRNARHFMSTWPSQVEAISVSFFSLACRGGPELMEEATQNGFDVYSWTINDPDAMKWAVAARVKGVITDFPDVLTEFFANISHKDLLSEYFTSEPRVFYSNYYLFKMWSVYLVATCYLAIADTFPWFFKRY